MMTNNEIKAKVFEIVRDNCAKPEIVDEKSLFRVDLGFDELDVVELVMEIEEKLHVEIDDEEIYSAKTVGDLVRIAQQAMGPVDIIEERLDSKDESELERR